jgi:hypothetical protein
MSADRDDQFPADGVSRRRFVAGGLALGGAVLWGGGLLGSASARAAAVGVTGSTGSTGSCNDGNTNDSGDHPKSKKAPKPPKCQKDKPGKKNGNPLH